MRNDTLNRTEPVQLLGLALPALAAYLLGKAEGGHDVVFLLAVGAITALLFLFVLWATRFVSTR